MECVHAAIDRFRRSPVAGLCFASLSGLCFTISNFMVQIAIQLNTRAALPVHEIVFARSVIQLVFLVPVIVVFRLPILVERNDICSLLLVSVTGFFNIVFIYMALEKIPISDTLVITFTSPIFTAILAFLILHEKCEWVDATCGFVSFVGVVIVARPTFLFGDKTQKQVLYREGMSREKREIVYLIGAGYALAGGLSIAVYFVVMRKFALKSQNIVNLFYPSIAGTFLAPALMFVFREDFVPPQSHQVLLSVLSVGAMSCLGLGLLTTALMLEHATNISLIRNLDVIYAYVLQYCAMGIVPSWWSVAGGVVIILSTSIMAVHRQTRHNAGCVAESESEEEVEEDEGTILAKCKEND